MSTVEEGVLKAQLGTVKSKPHLLIDPLSQDNDNEPIEIDGVVIIPGQVRTQSRALPVKAWNDTPTKWCGRLEQYTHVARMTAIKDLTYNKIEAMKNGDDNQVKLLTFKINALIGSLTIKSQFNESIKSSMVNVSNHDGISIVDSIVL